LSGHRACHHEKQNGTTSAFIAQVGVVRNNAMSELEQQ